MAVGVTVTDPRDGATVLVSVTGSAPGDSHEVQVSLPGRDWEGTGTVIAGDGQANVPGLLRNRVYSVRVMTNGSDASAEVGAVVTRAVEAVNQRAMVDLALRFGGIGLDRIGRKVHLAADPEDDTVEFPCIVLDPLEQERIEVLDQCSWSIQYPVNVSIWDRGDSWDPEIMPDILLWRQLCMDEVQRARVADPATGKLVAAVGVPEIERYDVESKPILEPEGADYMSLLSAFTVWVTVFKDRKGA